jgi:hypothetical protein
MPMKKDNIRLMQYIMHEDIRLILVREHYTIFNRAMFMWFTTGSRLPSAVDVAHMVLREET